jgi:hypothetical protein
MTRREFVPLMIAPISVRAQDKTNPRSVVIVRDVSPSFKNTPPITTKLSEIIHESGPGDSITVIELGGPFSPEACVKIQCIMPRVPPELLSPVKKLDDWRRNQTRLDNLWHRVRVNQTTIEEYLGTPPPVKDPTPLFDVLAYAAGRLKFADGTRILVVFSDFIQDSSGVKSSLPPKGRMDFTGVSAFALFVPWDQDFSRRAAAWHDWFVASGATDFAMLDGAQSQVRQVLDKSAVPRILPQRF